MAKKIESDLELEAIALKETYEQALKEIREQALARGYAFLKPTEGKTSLDHGRNTVIRKANLHKDLLGSEPRLIKTCCLIVYKVQ